MDFLARGASWDNLKSWVVEDSGDRASRTEIDRHENNSDVNDAWAVNTFAVVRSVSFRRIRSRHPSPNHRGENCLVLCGFDVIGSVAGVL
jgi:hypothetical protein